MPFEQYMEKLAQCDFFLSPFPHGGMTTIMDTFQLGLPGVCLDGAEPHAHADAAIFARIGLPTDLVAKSLDGYVAAAIKLIDDEAWRKQCGAIVRDADLDAAFFNGDPSLFAAAVENLIWPQST
jgi:predicted O-linked N-acetylglucosamine transferase (SPINDLY family)